jgi:hypothetical protein
MNNFIGVVLILALASCTNANKPTVPAEQKSAVSTNKTGIQLEDPKLQAIYEGYLATKDALVASKYDATKSAASRLSIQLADYEGCESTSVIAKNIESSKNVTEQRKHFTALSSDLIAMFKHASVKQGVIYVQHCPMANHGKGGDWLSAEKKIQNPYYGADMLECGAVTEEIKKGS